MALPDAAAAALARLPQELSPLEESLRDQLCAAARTAERLLQGLGANVALQDWVECRIPTELQLYANNEGRVVLTVPGAATADKAAAPAVVKPPAKAAAASPGATAEDFFSKLPEDHFSPQEQAVRQALIDALAAGPQQVTQVAMGPVVSRAYRALAAGHRVPLLDWIEQRIGEEVRVFEDPVRRQQFLELVSGDGAVPYPPQQSRKSERCEAFFATLPADCFTQAEEALRDALFAFLATWRSPELANLAHAANDPAVREAKAVLLPKDVPFREWIQHRIDAEIQLQKDAKGQWVIHVTPEAHQYVMQKAQAIQQHQLDKTKEFEEKQLKKQQFYEGLPADGFAPAEEALREAILEFLQREHRTPEGKKMVPSLTNAGQDPEIKARKADFLPGYITLREWIEHRIGEEVVLTRDQETSSGKKGSSTEVRMRLKKPKAPAFKGGSELDEMITQAERDAEREQAREALAEKKEAFFAALPEDGFLPEEEALREALMVFIESWEMSRVPTLSDCGSDPAVREAKNALLPKDANYGVSLRDWIDARIGGEVQTAILPGTNKVALGFVGQDLLARPESVKRRKLEGGATGKGASGRGAGGGKGKPKSQKNGGAVAALPGKRQPFAPTKGSAAGNAKGQKRARP
eukprot:TRINITY_DN62751_c0_g1_i1.p1 TRINITY_DN62751_c0_g1~~TRINITY_DN62751_c0_g1_i1.p1  ORF type:complete len:656 (+),score=172.73 TRINITY_DN62751_c0_g1_i1:57-1970(+)